MAVQLLERVVVGPKTFGGFNKKKQRFNAKAGDTVMVTPAQAKAFPHVLVDPKVAAAQKAARDAIAEANGEVDGKDQEEPSKATTTGGDQ